MLAAFLLAGALGIVGYGFIKSGGFAAQFVKLVETKSRKRAILAWAAGTFISYGLYSGVALIALGRADTIWRLPAELRDAAWSLGLPAGVDPSVLLLLGGSMSVGVVLGMALLAIRRRRGKASIGLRYRSPAASERLADWQPAFVLALSAGVSEELFFRLTLPLLVAICFGSGLAGSVTGWLAFVALHRYQGWAGMVAVALIGAAFIGLYLLTGLLWVVILLHVLIDVNAFIVRPWLTRQLSSSSASPF